MNDLNAFPDAVGIAIGSGMMRDGVHYIHAVSERQQQQDQADHRRVRLEVAARLMAAVDPRPWMVADAVAHAIAAADTLMAANEAAPVPAGTSHSGPQNDATAPIAGDHGTAGRETA